MLRRKTRPGRLTALDDLLLSQEGLLLSRRDGPFAGAPVVDLGIGAHPDTTVELAARLDVDVIGVDVDPGVVARAQSAAGSGLRFVQGGFADVPPGARLVRALNVLRSYRPEAVPSAHAAMGADVLSGGLVIEGSCGPTGDVGVVHALRRTLEGLHREALWFWTDGSRGAAPVVFRDRLPVDLRHAPRGEHAIWDLFDRWMGAFEGGHGRILEASVERLSDPALTVIGPGAVRWAPRGGVP